jgi:alginate O-acetyltransferase complex protein AlgI
MSFNSLFFLLIFLPSVIAIYYRLGHRAQNRFLVIASCIFYASWDWRFLLPLLFTASLDFFIAQKIQHLSAQNKAVTRKNLLVVSVVSNIGLLCYFKYSNFFLATAFDALSMIGIRAHVPALEIGLPVAISFYTFQALSYTIDVYRADTRASDSYFDFLLAVMYFPHLVAGPIQRAASLIPQITHPRKVELPKIYDGLHLIFWGLFKKVCLADNLAVYADLYFGKANPNGADTVLGVLAFTFQIYCDFSGYSDMARGMAKLMGFEFIENFKRPYLATNPSDFWRRWHISLSTWLRDYLYKPLGGSRKGRVRTYINLSITMVIGGLWHGAAWNFILWGFYHGVLLALYRVASPYFARAQAFFKLDGNPAWTALKIGLMFTLTCYGWLLFRAKSLQQISEMTAGLVQPITGMNWTHLGTILSLALPLIAVQIVQQQKNEPIIFRWIGVPTVAKVIFYSTCLYGILFLGGDPKTFVYFQF